MASVIADLSEVLLQLGLDSTSSERERAIAQAALKSAVGAVIRYLQYDPTQKTHIEYYPQMDFSSPLRETIWDINATEAYERQLGSASANDLQVQHIPVRSITHLYIDYDGRSGTRSGSFGASTEKTEGIDFWPNYDLLDSSNAKICRDGIIKSQGLWPDVPGSVKIEYIAGYTSQELHGQDSKIDASPINEAVIDEAVRRVLKISSRSKRSAAGFTGPLSSETLGDYSYTANAALYDKLIGVTSDILPETAQKLSNFVKCDWGVM